MAEGRRVYIIGFMGSGKSTAGKKLASFLGWQFIDLDKEIEHNAGIIIKDIFSTHGEGYFRELESSTLAGLQTYTDTIISAGGGTPCHGTNMDFMLKTGLVIYLQLTPGQLKSRLEDSSTQRPLIRDIPRTELLQYITDKLAEREKYYLRASISAVGIDLDIKALSDNINSSFKEKATGI